MVKAFGSITAYTDQVANLIMFFSRWNNQNAYGALKEDRPKHCNLEPCFDEL